MKQASVSPLATPATSSFFSRTAHWLFAPTHFRFKLIASSVVGILVIGFLATIFVFLTFRNNDHDALRNHTVDVIRLGSAIVNDLDALEARHRGYLLASAPGYVEDLRRQSDAIQDQLGELTAFMPEGSAHRQKIQRTAELLRKWNEKVAQPEIQKRSDRKADAAPDQQALKATLLNEARSQIRAIQDDEQILLNQKMRAPEWPVQSTRIIDFLPKLEGSVIEMQKEKRGYLLSGNAAFVEAYKRAETNFYTLHSYLVMLVAGSPDEVAQLTNIRTRVEKWMAISAVPEINARLSGKSSTPVVENKEGEGLTNEIRDSIHNFELSETAKYETRTAKARHDGILKSSGLALLCLFATTLLVVSTTYTVALSRRQVTQLRGAETHIRSIIDHILDGMIAVDEKGFIRSMNPAAEKMFSCLPNEMVGHKFIALIPKCYMPDPNAEPVVCAWQGILERVGQTALALAQTRKKTTFPVEISLSEMTVDEEKLYVAMVRDVTEQKHSERELAAEKESLAVTLRSIGDGVITTDIQGRIVMINHAGENMTGWTSSEAVGQALKSVFNIAIDLAAQSRMQKSGYRNEAHSLLLSLPESATLRSRDGMERIIEQVASPIRDSNNEIAGVVLVFRDITERQRNEEERRKAETLEQLGLLAGGIAHDFNNLLTAIIGNISLASLLLPPNDEMAARLNDAKNASLRARDLAQQLLTFARGGAPIKKTASIGKLIQDTVSFSLRGSHSRSEFEFGADLWPAEIDPGQISQVIANLVVNADQAMSNGGVLRVACDNFSYDGHTEPVIADLPAGDYIRLSLRDEGTGISEDYLTRIFDPYFTTKSHGNGLGLATTYSIIKNHNGLITVESQLHVGSTFTIYLPALRNLEMPVEVTKETIESVAGTGRILIVDDEEAIRALVEFTLTRLGYDVFQAENAQDGVDLYREKYEKGERFDAVILDLTLPGGMGGKEALKKLIEIDPTVNAIVSSGYATDATMSRYQDFGFRGVIAKPYEAAELGRIVHDVVAADQSAPEPEYKLRHAC